MNAFPPDDYPALHSAAVVICELSSGISVGEFLMDF